MYVVPIPTGILYLKFLEHFNHSLLNQSTIRDPPTIIKLTHFKIGNIYANTCFVFSTLRAFHCLFECAGLKRCVIEKCDKTYFVSHI